MDLQCRGPVDIEGVEGGDDVGHDTRSAGNLATCLKGVNESRDRERTVRTIILAFELSREGKKVCVV